MQQDRDAEIDRNFHAFQKVVGSLISTHAGEFAILRHGNVDAFFKSASDALTEAYKKFPDGIFSVQEVVTGPLDLGFYSHVASVRSDG
jgi:hypothetical protein